MITPTPTPRGIALRQAAYPMLPSINQFCSALVPHPPGNASSQDAMESWSFRQKDSQHLHIDQRLPPISDLLRGAPWPLDHASSTLMGPPTPLPSPTGFSPYLLHAQPSPSWQAFPPRSQSIPGPFSSHLPLSPRKRSPDYFTPRSLSVPGRPSGHRVSTEAQAHINKHDDLFKLHWQGFDSAPFRRSPSYSDSDSDSQTTNNSRARQPTTTANRKTTTRRRPTRANTPVGAAEPTANTAPRRRRRNNKPYTFEQEAFLIYHRVDLHLTWGEVRAAFIARWPHLERTVGGLECIYYRTNAHLPATTPDGLLVLVDPAAESGAGHGGGGGGGGEGGEDIMCGAPEEGKADYKYYRGVAYRTVQVKCREGETPLLERFPEELVEERNEWVRAEHRTAARKFAQKRRMQREEWLASKTKERYARMMQL
ncbi:hypothetical protein BT67DRAFT_431676 [Trichocladium antarcticum]|uniref:Uncharacterized protein n=1 Tax=Trichocladium antarcticum TaxID=1450529 RepID=A0AAN6UQI4_9PEZI|nr:hypothetical protein BT67DRAFT_431676 [Trichocladium antarcticum]